MSTRRASRPRRRRAPRKNRAAANSPNRRRRCRVAQKTFRREHHERRPPDAERLTPQYVKVLGRGRRLADLEIVFGRKLEKPLDPGARVLGALPLIAVRQEQCQAGKPPPLVFGRGDELIDDHLRVVREVAELSLPEHKGLRIVAAVAVFEPEDRRFGQRRVVNFERSAISRRVARAARIAVRSHINEHGMPLAERSPF